MNNWRTVLIVTFVSFALIVGGTGATHGISTTSPTEMETASATSVQNESSDSAAVRSLNASSVAPGEAVLVTVRTTAKTPEITLNESIVPSVQEVTVVNVTVGGEPVTAANIATFQNGLRVALGGVAPESNVTVTYTIRIPEDDSDGKSYEIDGYITDDETRSIGTDTVSVPIVDIVGNYGDDGEVTDAELSMAIADWAGGSLTDAELSEIIRLWASSPEVRKLNSSFAIPGGAVSVTLSTTASTSTITFNESIVPAVQRVTIENVTVNSQPVSPVTSATSHDGLTVEVSDIDVDSNVTVRYTIWIAENASDGTTYSISGEITDNETRSTETDTFSIPDIFIIPPVSDAELSNAISAWARGELSDTELSHIISVWATS